MERKCELPAGSLMFALAASATHSSSCLAGCSGGALVSHTPLLRLRPGCCVSALGTQQLEAGRLVASHSSWCLDEGAVCLGSGCASVLRCWGSVSPSAACLSFSLQAAKTGPSPMLEQLNFLAVLSSSTVVPRSFWMASVGASGLGRLPTLPSARR